MEVVRLRNKEIYGNQFELFGGNLLYFIQEMLYDNLTSALHGRIWDGKEKLIEAISALLRSTGKKLASKWDKNTVETVCLLFSLSFFLFIICFKIESHKYLF